MKYNFKTNTFKNIYQSYIKKISNLETSNIMLSDKDFNELNDLKKHLMNILNEISSKLVKFKYVYTNRYESIDIMDINFDSLIYLDENVIFKIKVTVFVYCDGDGNITNNRFIAEIPLLKSIFDSTSDNILNYLNIKEKELQLTNNKKDKEKTNKSLLNLLKI